MKYTHQKIYYLFSIGMKAKFIQRNIMFLYFVKADWLKQLFFNQEPKLT